MHLLTLRRVELTMLNACPRTHALHAARADDRSGTHAVPVRERPFQHITDDFHVAVAVCAETAAGLDGIIVDDAQGTKLDMFGIIVIRERKAVPGIQPAVIGM